MAVVNPGELEIHPCPANCPRLQSGQYKEGFSFAIPPSTSQTRITDIVLYAHTAGAARLYGKDSLSYIKDSVCGYPDFNPIPFSPQTTRYCLVNN